MQGYVLYVLAEHSCPFPREQLVSSIEEPLISNS